MAWYFYPPAPGTKFGPCETPCDHLDCARQRRDAESLCRICQKPIGYEARIYFEEGNQLVHGECLEREIEAQIEGGEH
ncbi:MAG: hypothetical protein IT324_19575 [Anaerolineae bacterium]|nr:hypothetical protein [Anaerolineae bacterium]